MYAVVKTRGGEGGKLRFQLRAGLAQHAGVVDNYEDLGFGARLQEPAPSVVQAMGAIPARTGPTWAIPARTGPTRAIPARTGPTRAIPARAGPATFRSSPGGAFVYEAAHVLEEPVGRLHFTGPDDRTYMRQTFEGKEPSPAEVETIELDLVGRRLLRAPARGL